MKPRRVTAQRVGDTQTLTCEASRQYFFRSAGNACEDRETESTLRRLEGPVS